MGPVVSEAQWNKVQGLIQTASTRAQPSPQALNAPTDSTRATVKPTVFADVTNDMTIAQEEIFGPVVSIIGYDSVEQAIEIANDTEYNLAATPRPGRGSRRRQAHPHRDDARQRSRPDQRPVRRLQAIGNDANGASSASRSSSRARPFSALAPIRVPASAPGCVHLGAEAVGVFFHEAGPRSCAGSGRLA